MQIWEAMSFRHVNAGDRLLNARKKGQTALEETAWPLGEEPLNKAG
jgi:hypothetical protein